MSPSAQPENEAGITGVKPNGGQSFHCLSTEKSEESIFRNPMQLFPAPIVNFLPLVVASIGLAPF
jgi:hypothetical protein